MCCAIILISTQNKKENNKYNETPTFNSSFFVCHIPIYFPDSASTVQRPRDGYNTFTDSSTTQPPFNSFLNPKWNDPYFDTNVASNVTALVGKSAYLSCRVRNLGNKTVSKRKHFQQTSQKYSHHAQNRMHRIIFHNYKF